MAHSWMPATHVGDAHSFTSSQPQQDPAHNYGHLGSEPVVRFLTIFLLFLHLVYLFAFEITEHLKHYVDCSVMACFIKTLYSLPEFNSQRRI